MEHGEKYRNATNMKKRHDRNHGSNVRCISTDYDNTELNTKPTRTTETKPEHTTLQNKPKTTQQKTRRPKKQNNKRLTQDTKIEIILILLLKIINCW